MIPTKLPDYPWQKVGSDLFILNGVTYLLTSTTSNATIQALKSMFSRHGVPETVVSDNGPQNASQEFSRFAQLHDFKHVTSSPHYPKSNGQAVRTVLTLKKLLQDAQDHYSAIG